MGGAEHSRYRLGARRALRWPAPARVARRRVCYAPGVSASRKRPGRGDPIPDQDSPWAGPSRSQVRREASAVTALGLRLTKLKPSELAALPLGDELRESIELCRTLTKGAHGRQLRRVAKLLRALPEEDLTALVELSAGGVQVASDPDEPLYERWRARLLTEGDAALGELVQSFPIIDRQRLRQLIRQARRDPPDARTKRAAREVLRAIRTAAKASAGETDDN